jgi:hypothetical protein
MHLAITTYATARYTYALQTQAPLLLAALHYAEVAPADCVWIYASDGSPAAKAAFTAVKALLPDSLKTHHVTLPNLKESPDGQHLTDSNLTIARLQAAAWHQARLENATHLWSLESDILNDLQQLLQEHGVQARWNNINLLVLVSRNRNEQQRKRSTEHLSHFCHSSGISGKNVH